MQRVTFLLFVIIPVLVINGCSTGVQLTFAPSRQVERSFSGTISKTVSAEYLLYLPKAYGTEERRWPLVLFLHGAGERGNDLKLVKKHGPPKLVAAGKDFPFILVSPQCPRGEGWDADLLNALLDDLEKHYDIDPGRVYVTGLSMGGYGTWKLATKYPERFAAVAPICGGGEAGLACTLRSVPVWVFHGKNDNVVPITEAEQMVNALKSCGGNIRFTVYPEAGHDSWTETYDNPEFYEWMLAQSRTPQ